MTKSTLAGLADRLGLDLAVAKKLARGAAPSGDVEAFAAAGLRHGYGGDYTPEPSSLDAYDLGLRLLAQANGGVAERTNYAPRWSTPDMAGIVITRGNKSEWNVDGRTGLTVQQAHDAIAKAAGAHTHLRLETDKRHTLTVLIDDLRSLPAVDPIVVAVVRWWDDASCHAGCGVVVPVVTDLASMYATSSPSKEGSPAWWAARVLGVSAATDHQAVGRLAKHVAGKARGAEAMLEAWTGRLTTLMRYRDKMRVGARLSEHQQHVALRSMSANDDWHQKWVTLGDPAAARAARWVGNVVEGTWVDGTPSSWTFAIGGAVCRYRPGSTAALVIDASAREDDEQLSRIVNVDVESLTWDSVLGTCVTVTAFGKPNIATQLDRACGGRGSVVMQPERPNEGQAARAAVGASERRRRAQASSWLSDPARAVKRREVPWDVLVQAASE